jgi:Ras-related protein Rab-32
VLVIGDYAVGKTSIIRRYCDDYFTPNYKLTIGVDFALKSLKWDDETIVSLQLWDVAGHERFGTMTRVYYKYAIAAIIVFDVTRPSTFEAVVKWRDDINSKVALPNGEPIPLLLLANKCDLPGVHIDTDALDKFAAEQGFSGWFASSALNNTNIDEAMKFLIAKILDVAKRVENPLPPGKEGEDGKQILTLSASNQSSSSSTSAHSPSASSASSSDSCCGSRC